MHAALVFLVCSLARHLCCLGFGPSIAADWGTPGVLAVFQLQHCHPVFERMGCLLL